MYQATKSDFGSIFYPIGVVLAAITILMGNPQNANAQSKGWNAVYGSGSNNVAASYAIVDATQYGSGSDICAMINNVFVAYNPSAPFGVVVDARGVTTPSTCSGTNDYPWYELVATIPNMGFSNVVLLPAGTITIGATWILPSNTHLIGQGPTTTVIQAASSFSQSDMIDMGEENQSGPCAISVAVYDCPGIVIEHLKLVGNGSGSANKPVYGINNCCAQEISSVNDVFITNVVTGLALTDSFSENSGPYTNLLISGTNTCLAIGPSTSGNNMINTRGVHGLSCVVASTSTAAITIDAPNNSLEDVSISGPSGADGILIGSKNVPAEGNTLINIQGSGLQNVIHISSQTNSNPNNNSGNCPYLMSGSVFDVCDLTILGVANSGSTNTIRDDLTISGTPTTLKDSTLGVYVLGENIPSGSAPPNYVGYTRYTTATTAGDINGPSWLVGPNGPTGTCAVGTLFSCTGTTTACRSAALWQCVGGSTPWQAIQ